MKEYKLKKFTWLDMGLILLLGAGAFAAFPLLSSMKPGTVVVFKDNSIVAEYPVSETKSVEIDGVSGKLKIEIANNAVQVVSSGCPHQVCVNHKPISHPNTQIVCVPNHVL
ncbi:MAG: NusG domain II-containing protein, partial [Fibrobacter sp.]|nr:NusG domain II-containing protein [Fibrobacter sp.]